MPKEFLPADTVLAWEKLAPLLPAGLYLGGGTAVAVHLRHRESQDLDFFYHQDEVDLGALRERLGALDDFALTQEAPGTLKGLLGKTRIEVFHCDQVAEQERLEPCTEVAGIPVAGLRDLMAMKLNVLSDRGEMRDYFDVKAIDEHGLIPVEEGISLFLMRFGVSPTDVRVQHLIQSLGYLEDVEEDEALPVAREELAEWWARRQAEVVRNLRRTG